MVLQANDFKIENDGIWISKKALEECKQHYNKFSLGCDREKKFLLAHFYIGKSNAYNDLLKHFEQESP